MHNLHTDDYTKIIRIEGATVMVKAEVLKGQEDFNAMRPHWVRPREIENCDTFDGLTR